MAFSPNCACLGLLRLIEEGYYAVGRTPHTPTSMKESYVSGILFGDTMVLKSYESFRLSTMVLNTGWNYNLLLGTGTL